MYVLPHCSTGGMPAYVLKQIESFKGKHDISVVEVNNFSDQYVVQRNKIKSLVPLKQLHGRQELLFLYILEKQPDVIHFQEIPESFFTKENVAKVYDNRRKYNVVVTTHSSNSRRGHFTYTPDRIVAVCEWQRNLFKETFPETQVGMWKYPIEDKTPIKEKKLEAKIKLNFSKRGANGLHGYDVLNVGLFTPGKNQGELFEIAKKNPQNTYHFVGNQAGNFESYWKPLMENKPKNCIIWGEREDVELFYQACDEMYFSSKFELFPIVIREALSYGLPVKMRKLPTYLDEYDNNKLVTYIN